MSTEKKKFLLTAGRSPSTLDLARQLHFAGHTVYIADTIKWHVCRFSNAVSQSFVVPSPRFKTEAFIQKLLDIVNEHQVDCLIPTFEEILFISKYLDRFPKSCRVFSAPFEKLLNLHNKWLFFLKQKELGIDSPETFLIQSKEDLKKLNPKYAYALKASYSRSSQNIIKAQPGERPYDIEIEPHNPWIAQRWLEGNRFCTYSVCQNGKVLANATYPVQVAIQGHFCLNYESVDHAGILEWIKTFVAKEGFTGQIGFDFFETAEGKIYAIECNPRATHGLVLFKPTDRLDRAFITERDRMITPEAGNRKQVAAGMTLYGWKSALKEKKLFRFFEIFFSSPDVVFDRNDIKPFLFTPLVYSSYIMESVRARLNIPAAFTYDFNWDGDEVKEVKEIKEQETAQIA